MATPTLPPFHIRPLCSHSLPDGSTGFSVQLEYRDDTGQVRAIFASGATEQEAIFAAQQKLVEAVRT